MATFTTNCKLHQWEPEDDFLRTDFNEDFAKIDAAFGKKADSASVDSRFAAVNNSISTLSSRTYYAVGSYDGDNETIRNISLGFAPKAVLLEENNGLRDVNGGTYGGFAVTGSPLLSSGKAALEVTATGFRVNDEPAGTHLNQRGRHYNYIAFK